MNPNGRKRLAAVLRGLAWGVAIAAALYAIALWLLLRPLASSVADGWIDAVDNEPAGAAEEPAAPSAAATATADERIRRAFAKLSARVSPDDVRRNVAEEDWDDWNETAWPAVHALDDFYRETASVPGVRGFDPSNAVLAMADGNVWTNGLDFALGGVRLDPTELGYFIWVNQAAQKYAHTEEGFPELPCRFNTTDDPFFPAIHGWRMLVRSGWLLDWDDRRLVVRIAAPPPLPDDDADSEATPDFAAFLACQHHLRDDPTRIRPESFLRHLSYAEGAILTESWKRIRKAWCAVEKSDDGWRLVEDSDDVLPPVSVLAAAMWEECRVYLPDREPAIRRDQALRVLSFLRPAQLSAILAGPPDDPRRGFVLRALGLAHAFGCAPEWDGKDWADAADRFALDDAARIEPARALLLRSELFAPYRDEIERAGAEFPFRFRPAPPKPPSVGVSDIGPDPRAAELLFEGDAAISPEDRRRIEIRPPVVRRKPDR